MQSFKSCKKKISRKMMHYSPRIQRVVLNNWEIVKTPVTPPTIHEVQSVERKESEHPEPEKSSMSLRSIPESFLL
jgi:hypothetical protein